MLRRRFPARCYRYISNQSSALDLNSFKVNETLSSRSAYQPKLTERSSLQFNFFLQAISNNDIPLGFKIIKKFEKSDSRYFDSIYYQCLSLLFFSLVSNRDHLNIRMVKTFIDMVQQKDAAHIKTLFREEKSYDMLVMKANILKCLVYCYLNTPSKSIIRYSNKVFEGLDINVNELVNILKEEDLKHFEDVFNYSVDRSGKSGVEEPNTVVGKDPVTLNKLFEIIKGKSDDTLEGEKKKKPLYEVYEELPESQKLSFWDNYNRKNTAKQFQIEASCEEVKPDFNNRFSKKGTRKGRREIFKFQDANYIMMNKWISDTTDHIIKILEENTVEDRAHPVYIFGFVLRDIKIDQVVSTILSHLLSAVLTNENGFYKLTHLVDTCSETILRYFKASSKTKISGKFLNKETSMKLSESILQILVTNSHIGSEALREYDLHKSGTTYRMPHTLEYESSFAGLGFKTCKLSDLTPSVNSIKTPKIVRSHPYLLDTFTEFDLQLLNKKVYLPMLVPPNPWVSVSQGGYLTNIRPFMLTEEKDSHSLYLERAQNSGQLASIFKCLNQLGEIPWAINPDVLNAFSECMKLPSGFLTIPPPLDSLKVEPPSSPYPVHDLNDSSSDLKSARAAYWREYKKNRQKYFDSRSERFKYFYLETSSLAFAENGDTLYFPHGVDFRGRIYPLNSVLSHHSEDLVRGLLMFWHSKPLGENGFAWLKYQLAGVYGHDKLPFDARIKWVDNNISNILNLGSSPTPWSESDESFTWWMESEKPWQTYAICKEFVKIHEYNGDISLYKCRIPIHQDGSCNGLQHYAALSLDYEGGKSVNLVPSKERQDVYSTVLDLVRDQIEKDCADGHEISQHALKLVSRSVVKRTVMTSVYGVTKTGAYKQIQEVVKASLEKNKKHRRELLSDHDLIFIESNLPNLIEYLTNLTLHSITKLFSGAKLIENWLRLACVFVIKSFDADSIKHKASLTKVGVPDFFDLQFYKPMMWSSLSGLPIIQTYKHYKYKNLKVMSGTLRLREYDEIGAIDLRKQKNGIAPNFIHSIDSIHLQMTCMSANSAQLSFAAVHDSFWTHPCDVNVLNKIIREEFVELHTSNVLESLRSDLLYITRHSLQLCWISKSENKRFYESLRLRRVKEFGGIYSKRQSLNIILFEESKKLLNPDENRHFVDDYYKLLEDFKPKLYFQLNKGTLIPYDGNSSIENDLMDEEVTFNHKEPILVPVNITQCPPKGNLDVTKVTESEHFFS
ncbi:putative DNA-directed RNA polymerase [[Candida] railenensis]|uniref:DNA-directed RNA polymerase n=1 Tax=[Candida] railenensis TaxID=45579 RepID=A0A9P0QTK8_9ASCO|nr:putative DNA-directed RNA polymerase [[Candida] railenensis]